MTQTNRMSPRMRFFFSRVFPVPFILVGALTFFTGVRELYRAWESTSWPVVDATIRNSAVDYTSGKDNGGGTYHAEVHYDFVVGGQAYAGNKIAFGDYGTSDPSYAKRIVNRYPKGASVKIYCQARDPDQCVLEPGVKGQTWFLPCFALVFLATGIMMAVFLPRLMKAQEKAPENADNGMS
jgi:hypothetical protein